MSETKTKKAEPAKPKKKREKVEYRDARHRFEVVAGRRVGKAISSIDLLSNIRKGKQYDFTEADVARWESAAIGAIKASAEKQRASLRKGEAKGGAKPAFDFTA